jgi:hypothetical protein
MLSSIVLVWGYHNDGVNSFFRKQINPRIKTYLKINLYTSINKSAHFFDLKGKTLSFLHPVNDSNIVKLSIPNKQMNSLIKRKKKWIDIGVFIDNTLHSAKLKFHGTSSAHYFDGKYSFRIKMKKKSRLLNKMKVFNLIKAEEADPTIIAANKLAANLGLIASYGKMVMLKINNKDWGAYYLVERISDVLLEREFSISTYSKLSNVADWTRKENNFGSNHISDFDLYSGHIESNDSHLHALAIGKYKEMCLTAKQENSEKLIQFFDIEYMGKYLALLAMFNDIHHVSGDNFKLIYDFKSNKFYPIYRQENGSQPLFNEISTQEDAFFNNYTNFNKFVFFKSLPNYSHATNTIILKLFLSNEKVRNLRDKYLYQIVKAKKQHLNSFKDTYKENLSVLYASSLSRRSQYFKEKQQLEVFSSMCDYAEKYINYAHIYGSFNLSDSNLNMIADAFCQVKILSKQNLIHNYYTNGIGFDNELNIKYQYIDIPIKNRDLEMENLIFINNITKDTINPGHIYINKLINGK